MSRYILPSSESQRCLDRFSLLDEAEEDADGLCSLWRLIENVLDQPVHSSSDLSDVLSTISHLVRGSDGAAGDYGTLKGVVESIGESFYTQTWPQIRRCALDMPKVFANSSLDILEPGKRLRLSREQAASLVAHQFLCTLAAPSWRAEYYDFSIWYDSNQRHPVAAEIYITTVLTYFRDMSQLDGAVVLEYSLHALPVDFSSEQFLDAPLSPLTVTSVPQFTTELEELAFQQSSGAVVVSANKDIGFGQSATQEELFVGNCPEACPAVLVTPTLKPDQVLVVEGAAPMLRITGQRRDISWTPLPPEDRRGGRLLFMDALEIDELDADDGILVDLKPFSVDRELQKAYTAFSSWLQQSNSTVWTGLWGCGAFNGDPTVKMIILWMAASMAGRNLCIVCDASQEDFAQQFDEFAKSTKGGTVSDLQSILNSIPKTTERLHTLEHILSSQQASE
ncbi:hypothetical protein VHEMI09053 [[Torrubiella] hemipterigena]|uniref:poly(ADP-ribose) glycohydrolase n=1 Tax=[Torrubiella] hemipterigena TaxID=1531966 RepID=A0A0A1TQT1_9HYPO|nr:hypothetical protein VHEMI09053 [[Torrubiella] hemipterigena]